MTKVKLPRFIAPVVVPLLALGAVLFAIKPAHASWPVPQHDVARTGRSGGTSNISTPGIFWRYFLGGNVGPANAAPIDVDGDGIDEAAYVVAGRLYVAARDGTINWRSENLGLTFLVGIADLNGDGKKELIAQSLKQAYVFERNGTLAWTEPATDMGTIGGSRVGDVDGDGVADLAVQECRCCQVSNGAYGFVYSFKKGSLSAPQLLWNMPQTFCGGGRQMMLADFDGDGKPDLTIGTSSTIEIVNGATGLVTADAGSLGTEISLSRCDAIDVDGLPPTEIVCALGTAAAPGTGHRVYVLRYVATPTPHLQQVWSTNVGDLDQELGVVPNMVADLDGDGTLELMVSGTTTAGDSISLILDAATGTTLATLPGEPIIAAAKVNATSTIVLTKSGTQTNGYTFSRTAATPLSQVWMLPNRRPLLLRNWDVAAERPLSNAVVMIDVNGDGNAELLTADSINHANVIAYDLSTTTPSVAAMINTKGGDPLASWRASDGSLVLSSTDGILRFLKPDLSNTVGGVKAGGYFDSGARLHLPISPILAPLAADQPDRILMTDSRKTLVVLDGSNADNITEPATLWTSPFTSGPGVFENLDNGTAPGVACHQTDVTTTPPTENAAAFKADGTSLWQQAIGATVTVYDDTLAGNFDGDLLPDVVVLWGNTGDNTLQVSVFAGATGLPIWTRPLTGGTDRDPSGAAIADWNGDGIDDVIVHFDGTHVLDGANGADYALGGNTAEAYYMPTLVNVDSDPDLEILLDSGEQPINVLDHNASTHVWASSDSDKPFPYGATAQCGGTGIFLSTSSLNTARLKISQLADGNASTFVFAGGHVYADETAATNAGATLGQLTSVVVHDDLTGTNHPSAVFGSSDGWLYSLNPCSTPTVSLDWAFNFNAPVGAIAFGDTDGDSLDEILVSVADGYLYDLKNQSIGPPDDVRDADPNNITNDDIDVLYTMNTLAVTWDAVDGATGYDVAEFDASGNYITSGSGGPWISVGNVTQATIPNLTLTDGTVYYAAVRSHLNGGVSPERTSDGVLVHLSAPPLIDAGVGTDAGNGNNNNGTGGGCCDAGGSQPPWLAILIVLPFLIRKRR